MVTTLMSNFGVTSTIIYCNVSKKALKRNVKEKTSSLNVPRRIWWVWSNIALCSAFSNFKGSSPKRNSRSVCVWALPLLFGDR